MGASRLQKIAERSVIDPNFFEDIAGEFGDVAGKLPVEVEM